MDMSHCCDAFRGLREVKITFDDLNGDGWVMGNFPKILSGAIDLECLWVSGSCCFYISAQDILGTTTWSHLTCLDFSNAAFDQGELVDLLRRHSATLLDVRLLCIFLADGSWESLLRGMKSYLSLQDISIQDASEFGETGEVPVEIDIEEATLKDYLLGNGPHPLS